MAAFLASHLGGSGPALSTYGSLDLKQENQNQIQTYLNFVNSVVARILLFIIIIIIVFSYFVPLVLHGTEIEKTIGLLCVCPA
jgi:hypothetical protein